MFNLVADERLHSGPLIYNGILIISLWDEFINRRLDPAFDQLHFHLLLRILCQQTKAQAVLFFILRCSPDHADARFGGGMKGNSKMTERRFSMADLKLSPPTNTPKKFGRNGLSAWNMYLRLSRDRTLQYAHNLAFWLQSSQSCCGWYGTNVKWRGTICTVCFDSGWFDWSHMAYVLKSGNGV